MLESEEDRIVRERLSQPISPEFDGIEFKNVIEFLREVSGVNIHVNWTALQAVGIDKTSIVTVKLTNVTLEKALQVILDDLEGGVSQLGYIIDRGVITISTRDDLAKETKIHVYDIRDLVVRVPNFYGPRIDLDIGNNRGGNNRTGGGGGGGGLFGDGTGRDNNVSREEAPTRQQLIESIQTMIRETVSPESWRPTGDIGSIHELGGQLVVTQTPDNHERLWNLLNQLRETRTLQIAVEARFIQVSSGFLNSIGIDLDFYFNIGSRLGGGPGVLDPFTGAIVPVKGTSGWGYGKPGGDDVTPISAQQTSSSFTDMVFNTAQTGLPVNIKGEVLDHALTVFGTFLDDIQVDFIVQATQAHQATRQLTAPRLTLFNGQRAYVSVGTAQAYVSDLEPVVSDNAVTFDPEIDYVTTGTVLEVEATVSADRRYVTMTLTPQVTVLNGFTRYAIVVESVDPETGEPTTGIGFIQLPNVTIQTVETTVSVPDGGTLLLGGQKLSGEIEREMGVPLLSKIPVVNRLFTNRGAVRDEQTLLILIKPQILIQKEQEELKHPT
jgi:general secretion pathway protein D